MAPAKIAIAFLLSAQGAGATAGCSSPGECPAQPPVLLQTVHSMAKHAASEAPVPGAGPLVPAFVAPPGAEERASRWRVRRGKSASGKGDVKAASDKGPAPAPLIAASERVSDRAWEHYQLLKQLRAAGYRCPGGEYFAPNNGELLFDCRLWRASYLHSKDMGDNGYFSHYSQDGRDPYDRSAAQGFATFNENLAAGDATAQGTLDQWKGSDGHCKNMMKASHTRFAVAYYNAPSSTYKHYWTELFGERSDLESDCYAGRDGSTGGNDGGNNGGNDGGNDDGGNNDGGNDGGGDGDAGNGGGDDVSCADDEANCPYWAGAGYCAEGNQYEQYMRRTCPLSCEICGSADRDTQCTDDDSSCGYWSGQGYCNQGHQYQPFMSVNCKASCGLCN